MPDSRTPVQRAQDFLIGRSGAYQRVFDVEDQDIRIILEDLALFCRAHTSTANSNPHVASRLDGRREVWLRIQQHLRLDNESLWRLYDGRKLVKRDDDG